MKKKIKRFIKRELVPVVQFTLMLSTSTTGFFSLYSVWWWRLNLPNNWLGVIITLLLASLSEFGLLMWIRHNYG